MTGISTEERDRILTMLGSKPEVEEFSFSALTVQPEPFTIQDVRRTILAFEKRVTKNQDMRSKFADQPAKSYVTLAVCLHVVDS